MGFIPLVATAGPPAAVIGVMAIIMKEGESLRATEQRLKSGPPAAPASNPELADIGGAVPLDWDNDRAMLRAAAEALSTLATAETGDRMCRLLLLSGFLFGVACRTDVAK